MYVVIVVAALAIIGGIVYFVMKKVKANKNNQMLVDADGMSATEVQ